MGIAMKWAPMLLLAVTASLAQPLRVYSEFVTINIHETRKSKFKRIDLRRELAREQDMAGFDAERVDRVEAALQHAGVRAPVVQRLP